MKVIGIDTGKHTGFAVWDSVTHQLVELSTLLIHQAMERVQWYSQVYGDILVIYEDARQRKWYGDNARAKQQGAGSVKRDCTIWEDFLTDLEINHRGVAPQRGATKLNAEYFRKITGWKGRTSEHARDAAMLVFGR